VEGFVRAACPSSPPGVGGNNPAIEIRCDEADAGARPTDLLDNLGPALPAAAGDNSTCASAANTVTMAPPMLLVALVTSAPVLESYAHMVAVPL
jgi:hypothetical protein